MKIYLITTNENDGDYDVARGFVIVANNEVEVMNIAADATKCDRAPWLNGKAIISQLGVYTGSNPNAHVVLIDFNAG